MMFRKARSGLHAKPGQTMHTPVNVTRVYLHTYMQSGSTLLGQILDMVPSCFMYWYEIMDSFYMAQYGMPMKRASQYITHYPDGILR